MLYFNRGDFMKRKKRSSIIDTKDELIKNFSREQMEIYNRYKSKFTYVDPNLYPTVSNDREIRFLENGCNLLEKVLKVEIVVALIVGTFVLMVNDTPSQKAQTITYKSASVVTEYDSKN